MTVKHGALMCATLLSGTLLLHGSSLSASSPPASVVAPPSLSTIPDDAAGALVRLGHLLVVNTGEHAPAYVGNALNCRNCHLDAGRTPHAAPYVGLAAVYPEYRARNARLNTLEDRVNDCFERSMNGTALPVDSREMQAMVAYIEWLSQGIPHGVALPWRGFPRITPSRSPDPSRGARLYAERCTACHGADGHGTPMGPPLWGPRSYNIGAGMARVSLAAGFIKANMPLGQGGTLTDDEAYDLAAFIDSQPRPDFAKKYLDWPKGDKPADAPY